MTVRTQERPESEHITGSKRSLANEDELEQAQFRDNSNESSEYSQQPSAEFLERLEKVKKQEQELMHLNLDHLEAEEYDGKIIQLSEDRGFGRDFAMPGLNDEDNEIYGLIGSSDLKI